LTSPFDPTHLTPPISLNRVVVADLPGCTIDAGVKDKNGYQLVSAFALASLIREHADALALDPTQPDDVLNRALDSCLDSEMDEVRTAAEGIVRRLGRNLGYLLLALRRGDPVNRAARDEWNDSYWAYWATIRCVWLGGGIASPRIGPALCRSALDVFDQAGVHDYAINLSPYGSALPLVGMARRAPPDCSMAYVFDFGHTRIKRARPIVEAGSLRALERCADAPTGWGDPSRDDKSAAARLLDHMINVIDEIHAEIHTGACQSDPVRVLASIAAYMRDGQPLLAQSGAYVRIGQIVPNLQCAIQDRLHERWGVPVEVLLEHDGTAAAQAYAGQPHTAVITIGTALGIGFPPGDDAALRPLYSDFTGF